MPMLSDPMNDFSKPKISGGNLIGFVVNNVDEDDKKQRQRVRIRIPQLHRGVPDDQLPWAIPDTTQGSNNVQVQSGSQVGNVSIPPIGAKIYVRIEDNDPHNPRYSGSPSTDDVSKNNELLDENYPHTQGSIDISNNRDSVNLEKQTRQSVHSSGTTIFHVSAEGDLSATVAGNYYLGVQGDIVMTAKGDVKITGDKVQINEGGDSPTTPTSRPRPQIKDQAGQIKY